MLVTRLPSDETNIVAPVRSGLPWWSKTINSSTVALGQLGKLAKARGSVTSTSTSRRRTPVDHRRLDVGIWSACRL